MGCPSVQHSGHGPPRRAAGLTITGFEAAFNCLLAASGLLLLAWCWSRPFMSSPCCMARHVVWPRANTAASHVAVDMRIVSPSVLNGRAERAS